MLQTGLQLDVSSSPAWRLGPRTALWPVLARPSRPGPTATPASSFSTAETFYQDKTVTTTISRLSLESILSSLSAFFVFPRRHGERAADAAAFSHATRRNIPTRNLSSCCDLAKWVSSNTVFPHKFYRIFVIIRTEETGGIARVDSSQSAAIHHSWKLFSLVKLVTCLTFNLASALLFLLATP